MFAALLLLACDRPEDVARARTQGLSRVLARLAARRVEYVRLQDWCRGLAYDRGHFTVSDHPSTCALSSAPSVAPDPQAEADLRAFVADLESTGVSILFATFRYDGALVRAELELDRRSWFLGPSVRYVWAPTDPPTSMGSESRVAPLGDDWYLETSDLL